MAKFIMYYDSHNCIVTNNPSAYAAHERACFKSSESFSRSTSSNNSINPFQSWEYFWGFLLMKLSINVCFKHSLGSPWHFCSNTLVTLLSLQIKVAMSFHTWHALLIMRSFFFSPLSVYLSISSSSMVGDLPVS